LRASTIGSFLGAIGRAIVTIINAIVGVIVDFFCESYDWSLPVLALTPPADLLAGLVDAILVRLAM
jgi:hypothetical protein